MTNSTSSGGISASTALFFIFLVLKLCDVITWSWWWVTAPLWGGFALLCVIVLVVLLAALIFGKSARFTRSW